MVSEPGLFSDKLAKGFREVAEGYLEAIASRLRNDGLSVSVLVKDGLPADEVISLAGKEASIVVAMSSRGKSGIATCGLSEA